MTVSHAVSALLDALKAEYPSITFPTICLWDISMVKGPFDRDPFIKIVVQDVKLPQTN